MPKGSNSYKIYDLTWPAIIPIRSKLNIDLLSEENGKEICHYLTLTIWFLVSVYNRYVTNACRTYFILKVNIIFTVEQNHKKVFLSHMEIITRCF